jgi:hypothetical protein
MNNNILLAVCLAVAPLLLALIARLALLLALFLALIIVVVVAIANVVLQSIPLFCLLHDYFMVQKRYLHCLLLRSLPPMTLRNFFNFAGSTANRLDFMANSIRWWMRKDV